MAEEFAIRKALRGALVAVAGALMILPAYLNLEIFNRLHFELVVSLSISIMLFAVGTLLLIVVLGRDVFEPRA
ncbi:hypothetical protein E6H29_10025 [Candidatus Bathyarchaeota archaeon]|nr:MAG: hypothetical protein E6H29_10025 [Candidatus Bathyarchaeota archaeon]